MPAARSHFSRVAFLCFLGFLGAFAWHGAGLAQAQILQAGDIVIGGARDAGLGNFVGRIYRYRDGIVETVFDGGATPGLTRIGRLFIDSQARIVFSTYYCGGNFNSAALWRVDLATGVAEQLACFPYVASPSNIPPGLPDNASSFYFLPSLYPTKSLSISIDDDELNGIPQIGYAEAYGCTIGVTISGVTRPRAFRYLPDDSRFEDDISLTLLPTAGAPQVIVKDSYTYYASGGVIGRAQPSIDVELSLDGNWGSLSMKLRINGRNELLMSGDVLDNTLIPNWTVQCGQITDTNVPEYKPPFSALSSISNLAFVNGGLFATSTSVGSGAPYLFNLARRDPYLNPFLCMYRSAVQFDGPILFDGRYVEIAIGDGGRVLGTQRSAGKLVSIQPSGAFDVLASDLVMPAGIAVYPPPGDVQTARNLMLRIDEPVGYVLLTDPEGNRLGHDSTGSEVNDYGDRARIVDASAQGSPVRFYTLSDPADGNWQVHLVGTDVGPYTLRAYLADTSEGGTMSVIDGDAETGVTDRYRMVVTPPLGLLLVPVHRADIDGDGDVDGDDVGLFVACAAGPTLPLLPGCQAMDLDGDGDGDQSDFAVMQLCLSGADIPADPACAP